MDAGDSAPDEPTLSYESCQLCGRCVQQQQLLCPACVSAGSGADAFAGRRRRLEAERDRLIGRVHALLQQRPAAAAGQARVSLCECSLRVVQLRRSLHKLDEEWREANCRLLAARDECERRGRDCQLYRQKVDGIAASVESLRRRLPQERASLQRLAAAAAGRKGRLCSQLARVVYSLQEAEHAILQPDLRLPPLASLHSRSLDPERAVCLALLSASYLVQAMNACLCVWTPFQPVALTLVKDATQPSRDTISGQYRKLETALHALCRLHCVRAVPGDPLVTVARLVDSGRLGQSPTAAAEAAEASGEGIPKLQPIAYDPHHVMAEWEIGVSDSGAGAADDWVEIQPDSPIPADESCCESRASLFSSLWR